MPAVFIFEGQKSMRTLGIMLVACLVLAGLQMLIVALAVATAAVLAFGLIFRPRRTLVALGGLVGWTVLLLHPGAVLALLALGALGQWCRDQPP